MQDFEVIVVDDGSTDSTWEIANNIDDTRFRIIRQENNGASSAKNLGIHHSIGEYLAFLDADDRYLPNKLENQARYLDTHPEVGMVASGWYETDEIGRILIESKPWERCPTLSLTTWLIDCPGNPGSVMVRKIWVEHIHGFEDSITRVEDWDFFLRLAGSGCKMDWLRELVYFYRFHSNNKSRDARATKSSLIRMYDNFFQNENLPKEIVSLKQSVYERCHLQSHPGDTAPEISN